jgi:acyl-CoA reductase-like NAD-dependent aldehyde dehydrogenase
VAPADRAALLRSVADTVESHLDELAVREARNAG